MISEAEASFNRYPLTPQYADFRKTSASLSIPKRTTFTSGTFSKRSPSKIMSSVVATESMSRMEQREAQISATEDSV